MGKSLNHKEAAHYLRVTVPFVKWCTSYSIKADGTKLIEISEGRFSKESLEDFNAHMWADWSSKNVPEEVSRELRREARGRCGLCSEQSECLEEAHINRRGKERDEHCQHPHNLILLCPTCHSRYDSKIGSVDNATVTHAKETALARLMEAIDMELERARAIREAVDGVKAEFGAALTQEHVAQLVQDTIALYGFVPSPGSTPVEALTQLSGSVSLEAPVLAAQVSAYAAELSTGTEQGELGEWLYLDVTPPHGMCKRNCGELALVDEFACLDCDHVDYTGEQPVAMEEDEDGHVVLLFHGHRDETESLTCAHCDSANLEFSYEEYCSYCKAAVDKLERQ